MLPALLLGLLQAPLPAQAPSPIATVDVTPATATLQVGQTLQFSARALDASGQPVPGVQVRWFDGGGQGEIDSTGLLTAGYRGTVLVTAVVSVKDTKAVYGNAKVEVQPEAAFRVTLTPVDGNLLVGSRRTISGAAFSVHNDPRDDAIRFSSSNPRIASITADGRLRALAPGKVTISGAAGAAKSSLALQVVPSSLTRLEIEPGAPVIRTGDVVRFTAVGRAPTGQEGDRIRRPLVGGGR